MIEAQIKYNKVILCFRDDFVLEIFLSIDTSAHKKYLKDPHFFLARNFFFDARLIFPYKTYLMEITYTKVSFLLYVENVIK